MLQNIQRNLDHFGNVTRPSAKPVELVPEKTNPEMKTSMVDTGRSLETIAMISEQFTST
jgi:hypothetical protein